MNILGIDPGLDGALAMYGDGQPSSNSTPHLQSTYEIPTAKATGRGREVLWSELNVTWKDLFYWADHVFLERVMSRRGEGVSSAFKFGMVFGGLRGMIAAKLIPLTLVTPRVWMKEMGVGRGSKEASIIRAEELFPSHVSQFCGPRDGRKDGVAEAALIAKYGFDKLTKGQT